MRPHRARMVFSLLKSYGLLKHVSLHRPTPRSFEQLTEFHADDYIDFLRTVTPNNAEDHMNQLRRFNMGQIGDVDCPVFDGVYEFCQLYCGGSVAGAAALCEKKVDIAFNWSGGMHHAKKAEASGFCYCNDIVLGILELLKEFPRVLYVDIDIHHGDGVEEAFYLTDRVMTVSFHKYGEFFPGTGALDDCGYGKGKYYCVNVPLKDGMDDTNYQQVYEPIMSKVMEMFQPSAIVMCCGADSLSGDKLGCFNLSFEGHSHCIEFLAKYQVPMMVLGGGGYTLRNVARCWTYETGRLMGIDLPDELPEAALQEYNYYLDTQCLRISVSNMKNMNTKEELEDIKRRVLEHLSQLPAVPSVQMAYRPPVKKEGELPEEDPDARGGGQAHEERRRVKAGDESDNEEEMGAGRARRDVSGNDGAGSAPAGSTPAAPAADGATVAPGMQAATLATSEALNGGAGASPTPMETDEKPAAAPAQAADAPEGGAPGVTTLGAGNAVYAANGGAQNGAAGTVTLGASVGAGAPPSAGQAAGISILGPSTNVASSGTTPPLDPAATGAAAGSRPNIIGASMGANAPSGSTPPTAAEEGGIYRPQ